MAKPLLDRVKVIPMEIPNQSKGGIIFVQKQVQMTEIQCNVGTVAEIGPLAFKGTIENPDDEPQFKVGDKVFYVRHAGQLIMKKDGKPPERILHWRDIQSLVEEDDDLVGF